MLKRLLKQTIGEVKSPEHRLNVLMPVIAVLFLAGVIFAQYRDNIDSRDKIEKESKYGRDKIEAELHARINYLINKLDSCDKNKNKLQEERERIILLLDNIIRKQEEQKQKFKK